VAVRPKCASNPVHTPPVRLNLRQHVNGAPEVRLSLRAGFCLSLPLIIGLFNSQRHYAIVFAIGALWAISQDGLDDWRVRGPRLLSVALAAGVGVAIGATYVDQVSDPWALVVLLGVVASAAGFIEASNLATPGAYLLIGSILGAGLQFRGTVWQSCLCISLGALWVYLVAAITDARKRLENQRVFLSNAFNALANLVDAVGTPRFYVVRATTLVTLDAAQDVVGSARLRTGSAEEVALRQCLVVALRGGEVVSYLEGKHLSVDPSIALALRDVALTLKNSTGFEAVAQLRDLPSHINSIRGLNPVVTSALHITDASELRAMPPRDSSRASTRARLPATERLRFAAILSLAIVIGAIIAHLLDGSHGFWLPLSVAFILRPDLGPVITRALARTAGTVVGVGIAAVVAWAGNSVLSLVVLSCVMAAAVPWAQRRSHVLAVMVFTPIVFVFLALLGTDKYLFVPRIIDTVLAAAIVLSVDILLWSAAPSLRPAQQLEKARRATARYERDSTRDDPIRRHLLRRGALRAVANARSSFAQANSEPHPFRRPDPTTLHQLDEIESSIDAHTVTVIEGD